MTSRARSLRIPEPERAGYPVAADAGAPYGAPQATPPRASMFVAHVVNDSPEVADGTAIPSQAGESSLSRSPSAAAHAAKPVAVAASMR